MAAGGGAVQTARTAGASWYLETEATRGLVEQATRVMLACYGEQPRVVTTSWTLSGKAARGCEPRSFPATRGHGWESRNNLWPRVA